MDPSSRNTCMAGALRILSRRDHGTCELEDKLIHRGYSRDDVAAVLIACSRLGYLDDRRFAAALIRHLRAKGQGYHRIRQSLNGKGLAADLVAEALATEYSPADQIKDCHDVLEKKLRQCGYGESGLESEGRMHRFLLQRGYPSDVIRQVINQKLAEHKKRQL